MSADAVDCGAAAPAGALAMSVAETFEELESVRDEWDEFAAGVGASVYHSFDHCAAWWRHYGRGRKLRVLLFREAGALVGVLPCYVHTVWLGPVWLRIAGLVGTDSTLIVLDPAVTPRAAQRVYAAALRHLLDDAGCDVVKLAPVSELRGQVDAIRAAVASLSASVRCLRDERIGPFTQFELPESFDAYFAALGKKQRANHRRNLRALGESKALTIDVLSDPRAVEDEFPRFVEMHEKQWRAAGKLGHFDDWPSGLEYHRDLIRVLAPHGRVRFVRILLDGQVIVSDLCYSFGPTMHWFLPAREVNPELDKYSIGRLSVVEMIQFAVAAGFKRIEGGVGHYDYKLQLGGTEAGVHSFVVARPGALRAARVRAFLRLGDALHALYYKAWFCRFAPKLPLRRRPLWALWIRSRL